ncbi:MAG TPA: hypothetical protein PK313_13090, partial [Myxococcota bacterium]|nr:hypothetical protein [Myxococcota bacterium]
MPKDGTCNDGDGCTLNDLCVGGRCVGTPIDCDDNDSCTTDSCSGGLCRNIAKGDGDSCDDGND